MKNKKGIRFSYFTFENENGIRFSFANLKTKKEFVIVNCEFVKGKHGIYTDLAVLVTLTESMSGNLR